MSGIYHMNGVPAAYSTIAEDVQKGRDAKIAHLLAQVRNIFAAKYFAVGNFPVNDSRTPK